MKRWIGFVVRIGVGVVTCERCEWNGRSFEEVLNFFFAELHQPQDSGAQVQATLLLLVDHHTSYHEDLFITVFD